MGAVGVEDPASVKYRAFTGLRNDVDPERLLPAELVTASNVDLDRTGRLARRSGYTRVRTGSVHSLWASGALALFVEDAALKQLNTDYTATILRGILTPGLRMSYEAVNGVVYYSNAAETGVIQNGVSRSWGLAVPSLPGAVATVGTMPAGDYQYVLTWRRSDGQESGAGLAGRITLPAGSGITFALPVSADADVTHKWLYLSPPNGDVLYRALLLANATTSATYQNDTLELTLPLETQLLGPPPAGHLVRYYAGRMFVAVDDALFYSEPFAHELFDMRRYLALDGRITLFAPAEKNGVWVATDKAIGWVEGTDPDKFEYVQKADYGAIEGALDYVEGSLFGDGGQGDVRIPLWLTTEGVCAGMTNGTLRNLTRERYSFSASGQGAALFMPAEKRFVAVANV